MTTQLPNWTDLNQRITTRSDGTRDINADYDCQVECDAMALKYYTGKMFHGGVIKEAVYGYNYKGGTGAPACVAYCAHFGVRLYPIDASAPTLIQDIHDQIKQLHPVMITEPDPYLPAGSGWTHCIIMHEEGPGYLVAADPFIAADVTKTDSEWAQDLAEREIWVFEPIGKDNNTMGITLQTPGISAYFKAGNGDAWICIHTGKTIHGAIGTYYRTAFNAPTGGLADLGLPTSDEISEGVAGHPEIVYQEFEYGAVRYDPQHVTKPQPGAGAVFKIKPLTVIAGEDKAKLDTALARVKVLEDKFAQIGKDLQA